MKEINIKELPNNLVKMIADEWMLISAGSQEEFNMMTASWGFVGEMWNKECAVCAVRPQRYTMKFIDSSDRFALSFYGDNKAIHGVCGSKSGRDVDKVALTGLTPVFNNGTVYFKEARCVLICRKIYADFIKPECFADKDIDIKNYNGDHHKMFVGEIEKVLIKE